MDMTYVFGIHEFPFDDSDRTINSFYPTYFGNFAKFGHPTPFPIRGAVWDPVDSPLGFNFLSIDVNPEMKNFYHFDAVEFWNSIVPAIKNADQISPFGQRRPFPNPFDRRGDRGNALSNRDLSNSDLSNQQKVEQMAQKVSEKESPKNFGLVGIVLGAVVALAIVAGIIASVVMRQRKRRPYRPMAKSAAGKKSKNNEYELLRDNDDETLYYKSF